MDNVAPLPSGQTPVPTHNQAVVPPEGRPNMLDKTNPSVVSVTLVGCGGAGVNQARTFLSHKRLKAVRYFDTSQTNTRYGEECYVVTNGSGSGSNRAENARKIEAEIPQIDNEFLAVGDVTILISSLGGGSGSVISPLLAREYNKKGSRVIVVAIADTSSSVAAKNTLNTLKTYSAIAKNNNIYLPLILLTNDHANARREVDEALVAIVSELIDVLTSSVYEVDRNDRLNWINPTKVVQSEPGLKIMSFPTAPQGNNPKVVVGTESDEMVDSLLILMNSPDDPMPTGLKQSRLKKVGFFNDAHRPIIGKVSSDISSIEEIIDFVEKTQHQDASQKHQGVDRLNHHSNTDLIL